MRTCPRCTAHSDTRSLFCPFCGAAYDRHELRSVRLMGAIGVAHSSSPTIEKFWATGDPTVFD